MAGKLQIDPNSNSIVTVSVTRSSPSILPVELAGKALEMMDQWFRIINQGGLWKLTSAYKYSDFSSQANHSIRLTIPNSRVCQGRIDQLTVNCQFLAV